MKVTGHYRQPETGAFIPQNLDTKSGAMSPTPHSSFCRFMTHSHIQSGPNVAYFFRTL